ncbi:MAG: PilZ domain-containing protein [Desulfobacterales bacterium]|nr:MAG: PilZ domain-containing protein [Desulfobacterales bacterium]
MKKLYADNTNRVKIICPKCRFEKNVDATKFKDTQKTLKGRCRCGEIYQFSIEFRKKHRKHVRLPGAYIVQGKKEKGEIIIRELSLSGFRFECMNPHHILKGDTLEVKFNLDNPLRTEIRKLAKVIWVKDRIVGAHYMETKLYEKDLGFYLST